MRQAGQANMGFYPCPPDVVEMIASHIIPPAQGRRVAIVDPCCGEGAAIMQLRSLLGEEHTHTYGVDVREDNGAVCRTLPFTQFVRADALEGIDWERFAYDVIWFNPPYDWTDREDENKREEMRFFNQLIKSRRITKPYALFIGILPRKHMHYMAATIMNLVEGLPVPSDTKEGERDPYPQVFRFQDPAPELEGCEQVVVFGTTRRKARHAVSERMEQEWIKRIESEDLPTIDFVPKDESGQFIGTLSTPFYEGKSMPPELHAMFYDAEAGAALAKQHGWITAREVSDGLFAPPTPHVEVARPLSKGHLAAAITAGFLDGQVIDGRAEGGNCELVRGQTLKSLNVTMEGERQP